MTDQLIHMAEQQEDMVPANEPPTVTVALERQGICPYCEEPLDGEVINGLHLDCNREKNQEMEAAYRHLDDIIHVSE